MDKNAGVVACTYFGSKARCENITIYNNVVAGAVHAGFIVQGQKCNVKNYKFFNNTAHSIGGKDKGIGAIIVKDKFDKDQDQCYEGSYFNAYKNQQQGVNVIGEGEIIKFHHMTMIDNLKGFSLNVVNKDLEYSDKLLMEASFNKFYGETDSPDCPPNGGFCFKEEKMGVMASISPYKTSPEHPTNQTELPYHKITSESSWSAKVEYKFNEYHNFKYVTREKMKQAIFQLSPYSSDFVPEQHHTDSVFKNVDKNALLHFTNPDSSSANAADCGAFPCTGPLNVLYHFERSKFIGAED